MRLGRVAILGFLACATVMLGACVPPPPPQMTSVFIVRHAEYCEPGVDLDCHHGDPDSPLGAVGNERAWALAHFLSRAGVKAIYTTDWRRTKETATPISDTLRIGWSIYEDPSLIAAQVLDDHKGESVLIVGHGPTMDDLVNALGGSGDRCAITQNEFDNLCMVTVHESGAANEIRLQYGNSSLPDSGRGASTTIKIRSGAVDGSVVAEVNSLVPAAVSVGSQPLAAFELPEPTLVAAGSTYVIDWTPPGDAILTWMVAEDNPYPGGTAFGCLGTPMAGTDFVFSTYEARRPLDEDQVSASATGVSMGCGTPRTGYLYQSFVPSRPHLANLDLRLRVGGSFPLEPGFEMTTVLLAHHAEGSGGGLSPDGRRRAEDLAHVAAKAGISAVFVAQGTLAEETVQRISELRGLSPQAFSNAPSVAERILSNHRGEAVLVAGDASTLPDIVTELGGHSDACELDSGYDSLCAVTIQDDGEAKVAHLQYGQPYP